MTAISLKPISLNRQDWRMAAVVARREIKDSFRDWRIMTPIILLTVFFPALMNFAAGRMMAFVSNYGAQIIATQLIPFLLLVVGFFPMSFSLIIALETFVGEKERKSLEPLLATPLTDAQLYLGKMVAVLVPPLLAAYLGMTVYMVGLYFNVGWLPTWQLLSQTVLLTTVQGVIMVSAAVVISSQTTSVRAANLLASFIIVPMALLIQGEAAALFWGNHVGLWWLILALTITAVVLVRMGLHLFKREELMGRELDDIRLGWIAAEFWAVMSGRRQNNGRYPNPFRWYRQTLAIVPQLGRPIVTLSVALLGSLGMGVTLAFIYRLPPDMLAQFTGAQIAANLDQLQIVARGLPLAIFFQNVRVLLLLALLGTFTFGVLGILVFIAPWVIVGFAAGQMFLAGENPLLFIAATVLPHAIFELPAIMLAAAAALRWHLTVIAPPPNSTLSEAFITTAAEFTRIFIGLVLPILLLAAFVEAFITPQVMIAVYGR
ncbi:MAG: stage II sporulation protein M [Chloroflexi bacterium]|nr:stage II sporulation protein M [Chloroflexota bacterium]MBP7044089.1 stage II sporulation protein M [Chloroflexota bacterium]